MGCGSCSVKSAGGCATGGKSCGCNKRSVYNWLADLPEPAYRSIILVEVSFKQGARKDYYQCRTNFGTITGDHVIVESKTGFDIGQITMSGELVKLQLKKKKIKTKLPDLPKVIRKAKDSDIEKLYDLRSREKEILKTARVIARKLDLAMKIGDVEFQGNGKKLTVYYTAESRVDFRELIKEFAGTFRVKIEMKQIGMRQESALIGGIGSCGRELCCSTWLTEFKTVNTSAARYQNLSINQTKLTGQCGRLKCCLNYELDTYLKAWKKIPKKAEKIYTEEGIAYLQKTDVLRHLMVYKYADKQDYIKLKAEDVFKIKEMNKNNEKPKDLYSMAIVEIDDYLSKEEDLVGQIQLESLPTKKRRSKKPNSQKKPHHRKRAAAQNQQKPIKQNSGSDNNNQDDNKVGESKAPTKKKFRSRKKGVLKNAKNSEKVGQNQKRTANTNFQGKQQSPKKNAETSSQKVEQREPKKHNPNKKQAPKRKNNFKENQPNKNHEKNTPKGTE